MNGVLVEKAGDTNIKQFTIPDQWEPPTVKVGQPNFTELGNPGDWPEFCYCLSFKKDGTYKGYKLPMDATLVPISNGKQTMNSCDFFTMAGKTTPTYQQDMVLQEPTFSPIQER
eukprot:1057868-Ditylum_brightwellii.AAC.1